MSQVDKYGNINGIHQEYVLRYFVCRGEYNETDIEDIKKKIYIL